MFDLPQILFFYKENDYNDGYYLHFLCSQSAFSTSQVAKSPGFKTDLLIPLFPQDVHCYRNLFYMTTHISAAQMLPRVPPPPAPPYSLPPPHLPPPAALLHLWLLLHHPIH